MHIHIYFTQVARYIDLLFAISITKCVFLLVGVFFFYLLSCSLSLSVSLVHVAMKALNTPIMYPFNTIIYIIKYICNVPRALTIAELSHSTPNEGRPLQQNRA